MSRGKTDTDWSEDQLATLRSMFADGAGDDEIAERVGRTTVAVAKKRRKLGLARHRSRLVLTPDQEAAVIAARRAGWDVRRIAECAGVRYDALLRAVKDLEIRETALRGQ